VGSVAVAHGITVRQVSRIVKGHRGASSGASPAALAAIEKAVAQVDGEAEEIEEGVTPAKKARLAAKMAGLDSRRIDIYRSSGLLSPDTFAAASAGAKRARFDLLPEVNAAIREALTEREVDGEIIESVIDRVMKAAGVRLPGEDGSPG